MIFLQGSLHTPMNIFFNIAATTEFFVPPKIRRGKINYAMELYGYAYRFQSPPAAGKYAYFEMYPGSGSLKSPLFQEYEKCDTAVGYYDVWKYRILPVPIILPYDKVYCLSGTDDAGVTKIRLNFYYKLVKCDPTELLLGVDYD